MGEPQRVELVEQIFHEALERDDARRAGFLAEACAGDVALLAEVASLLASFEQDQDFLQTPAFNLSASDLAGSVLEEESHRVPEAPRVSGFLLVREVGHGGMGTVYEAFTFNTHGEVDQRVAIKLVKRGMDSEFILHRFERERRILDALDHPYVARLLDGGATDDGMPFFVMEYVEGLPLDQYVQAATLSTIERLGLFLKICEAVSYAHRHRVIHRDLKPSNILVTEDGVPKLLDFGVAKLLDLDSAGRTGDTTATVNRVMTPEYASPEQLRGLPSKETDDVYSLGVLLYILLTGRHPYRFRSRAPEEVLRSIVEQRVQRPSELQRDLRGNLDKVVLKALRKDSERRYAAVEEMAQDIRRHLAGQPVSARSDLLARHPAYTLSTIGVALLCLLLGVVGLFSSNGKPARSLAVMPFSDMGQGTYSEQLAKGITDPDFGSVRLECESLYEQMGRVDDWTASMALWGGFDAETWPAFRAQGLKGFWSVWYRRKLNRREWGRGTDNAELFARVGDTDRALEDLAVAMEARDHRVTQIKVNPILDPLRSDPRFAELLRRMNLEP